MTWPFMTTISPVKAEIFDAEIHYVISDLKINKQLTNSPITSMVMFKFDLGVYIRARMKSGFGKVVTKNANVVMEKNNIDHKCHDVDSDAPHTLPLKKNGVAGEPLITDPFNLSMDRAKNPISPVVAKLFDEESHYVKNVNKQLSVFEAFDLKK